MKRQASIFFMFHVFTSSRFASQVLPKIRHLRIRHLSVIRQRHASAALHDAVGIKALRRIEEGERQCFVATRQYGHEALGTKVLELYGGLKHNRRQLPAKLDHYLSELRDLEMLADLMASTFVNDPLRRQHLLEERSVNQRLRFLITYLRDEIGNATA